MENLARVVKATEGATLLEHFAGTSHPGQINKWEARSP